MNRLHPDDIKAIADEVYRRFHLVQEFDIQKVSALPLSERKAFWKAQWEEEKRAGQGKK